MPRHLHRWVSARVGHQSVVKEKGVRERVSVEEARVDRGGAASSGEAAAHERCHHLATDDGEAARPVNFKRGGLAGGRCCLQRDFLEECGSQVAPVTTDLPSEGDEDVALSANSWAVLGVLLVLRGLGRDPGDVRREIDGALLVRSDSDDVEDDAVAGVVRAGGD